MVERIDPARTGVMAGRVVGALTALLAIVSLFRVQSTFYAGVEPLLRAVGSESDLSASVLLWGNALLAGVARYTMGYVAGSLLGVLYDWLDRPPVAVLFVAVLLVGCADGFLATLDTGSVSIGAGYVLAWLCYVPVFVWLLEEEPAEDRSGPRRL